MAFHSCNFCQKAGPEDPDPDASKRLAEVAGFVFVWVPVEDPAAEKAGPGLLRMRVLCGHCAKYAKTHFIVATATVAADVLDPDDPDFETDPNW